MISLVLYGRNDNYGYNLHKRAAISFNCMAELLTDPDDEILFVDYNTPDDMPSFVEAILDTLTDQARRKIRVLRVRPSYHHRWREKTHLNALESVSRNIAIRRSNPNNKWILSTNTDMVFVARGKKPSLTDAARDLPRGYYGIPRFEMPESLWESLDRKDPRKIIASFAEWGKSLHLDEVIHSHKSIIYDGPGDFQLVPRDDVFKIHGFSEAMLRGWHVDSNFAKRCLLLYGETKSLFHRLSGYHCDHTKVVSPLHGHDRTQNDMVEHITNVTVPQIPAQAEDWGAPDEKIEELRFPPGCSVGFAGAIAPLLGPMPVPHYEATYTEKTWNQFTYHSRHALPYLADHLVTLPRDIDIAYAGMNDTLRALLAEAWRALGFTGRMLVLDQTAGEKPGCEAPPPSDAPYAIAHVDYLAEHASLFILDLGVEHGPSWPNPIFDLKRNPACQKLLPFVKGIQSAGFKIAATERRRMADGLAPRRIIFVNTISTELLGQVDSVVGQTATPFCTHARHGTVKPDPILAARQRRGEADRIEAAIVKDLMSASESWLPVDLLDKTDPHVLLNNEHRAAVKVQAAKSNPKDSWHPMALLSLSTLTGDFPERLEEFLTLDPAAPQVFLQRLSMLRMAAAEVMSRPWTPALAAILANSADRFLAASGSLPPEVRMHGLAGYLGLCRGASGTSLFALADRLVAHVEALAAALSPQAPEGDAWEALYMAEFALSRADATEGVHERVRQRLVAPALARLAAASRPGPATASRIALIASAPYARAVDPAASALERVVAGLLARGVAPAAIQVFPETAPDRAFLEACRARGIAVASPPDGGGVLGAPALAQRAAAMLQAARSWAPGDAAAIGDTALALAVLAQGIAPRQAALSSRLGFSGAPGLDANLTPDNLDAWLDQAAARAGKGAVHAAAD